MNKNEISFIEAKILRRVPLPNYLKVKFNKKRHCRIMKKLLPLFEQSKERVKFGDDRLKNNGPIWIFWWQGKSNMPSIVKDCFISLINNKAEYPVILITKDNFHKYTDISSRIINMLRNGNMTLTHFSDILRFNLLKNNGGLWIDATVFVTKTISPKYFNYIFTCSGFEDKDYFSVTKGNWCGFLIGGSKGNPLFEFMNTFFNVYWNKNNELIDYFLIDYALSYAYEHNIGNLRKYCENNKGKNNPNLFELEKRLNKKYDSNIWKKINEATEMYKLTYKINLKSNENTFYNRIVNAEKNNE